MVNHRNISAGESRWRVQLASLSLGEMKQCLNHFHYDVDHRLKLGLSQIIALAKHLRGFLNILNTHDCFPKCCSSRTAQCGLTPISRSCDYDNLNLGHKASHASWCPLEAWYM